jgi:hypothetical protein
MTALVSDRSRRRRSPWHLHGLQKPSTFSTQGQKFGGIWYFINNHLILYVEQDGLTI